jgi:Fic family protein
MKNLEQAPALTNGLQAKALKLIATEGGKELIHAINAKYYYWDKVKYYNTNGAANQYELWAAVKLSRSINSHTISFGKHAFHYFLTDAIQEHLHHFDLILGKRQLSEPGITSEEQGRYMTSSTMEEAIASSQIEGAVTTRTQAKEILRKHLKPSNKSEQMIVNNYRTIQYILEHYHHSLTKERLMEVHRLVTYRTLDDAADEGQYRNNNDVTVADMLDGETVYSPPIAAEIETMMNELFHFFNQAEEKQFIHPIIKGCIIHFMMGYIHPFVDGNGRTARALFYWYMLKNGYSLTEYLSISRLIMKSKNRYAQAFIYTETDQNDLTYFILYKMKTLKSAYESLQEYIEKKTEEKRQLYTYHTIPGLNERQVQILKWLAEERHLFMTIKEMETRFSISNQSARNDLYELVSKGYLKVIPVNKKVKGFSKSERFEELMK